MTVNEKSKTIDDKIKKNKAQFNTNREAVKISFLSSGNVSKYEFISGENILPKKTARKSHYNQKIWPFDYSIYD